MAKEELLEFPGVVTELLPNATFRVKLENEHVANEDKAMEGVNRNPFQRAEQNFEAPGAPIITRRRAVERLKLARNVPLEEYLFSKSVATKPVRQTVLSADRISQRFDLQNSRDVYQSMADFLLCSKTFQGRR